MDRLFDRLVFDNQSPVYLQIIAFVKQVVAAGDLRQVHDELVRDEVGQFVRRMKRMRLPFKDVIDLVSDLWDEEALP